MPDTEYEDKIAYGERGIKIVFIEDWIDANKFLSEYWATGNPGKLKKATSSLMSLWMNMSGQFKEIELRSKAYRDIPKIEYFIKNRSVMPSFSLLYVICREFGVKLKKMGITDTGMMNVPNASTDFARSF